MKSVFVLFFKLIISFFLLKFFFNNNNINFLLVWRSLDLVKILFLLLITVFFNGFFLAHRLDKIFQLYNVNISYLEILKIVFAEAFLNLFFPMKIINYLKYNCFLKESHIGKIKVFFLENILMILALIFLSFNFFLVLKFGFLIRVVILSLFFIVFISLARQNRLIYIFFITVLYFFSNIFIFYYVFLFAGRYIPLADVFLYLPIIIILSKLPISFSGIGVREYLVMFFFKIFDRSDVFSLTMIYYLFETVIPALIGMFFVPDFYRKVIKKK